MASSSFGKIQVSMTPHIVNATDRKELGNGGNSILAFSLIRLDDARAPNVIHRGGGMGARSINPRKRGIALGLLVTRGGRKEIDRGGIWLSSGTRDVRISSSFRSLISS